MELPGLLVSFAWLALMEIPFTPTRASYNIVKVTRSLQCIRAIPYSPSLLITETRCLAPPRWIGALCSSSIRLPRQEYRRQCIRTALWAMALHLASTLPEQAQVGYPVWCRGHTATPILRLRQLALLESFPLFSAWWRLANILQWHKRFWEMVPPMVDGEAGSGAIMRPRKAVSFPFFLFAFVALLEAICFLGPRYYCIIDLTGCWWHNRCPLCPRRPTRVLHLHLSWSWKSRLLHCSTRCWNGMGRYSRLGQ